MLNFKKYLVGETLRSLGNSKSLVSKINNQTDFDKLFKLLFCDDRIVAMRAIDVVEKVSITHPQYLKKHKKKIISLCNVVHDKEFKWHLPLLISHLTLNEMELGEMWNTFTNWAKDKSNSRIVRVNAMQALFEMLKQEKNLITDFYLTTNELEKENIPSINARIRILQKQIHKQNKKIRNARTQF